MKPRFNDKNRSYTRPKTREATQEDVDQGKAVYVGEIMPIPKKTRATKWERYKDGFGEWHFRLRTQNK